MPRVRPWREITIVALLVMELSWVVPWYRALTPGTLAVGAGRVFLFLSLWWLATYGLTLWMNRQGLKKHARREILLVWLLAGEMLAFWQIVSWPEGAVNAVSQSATIWQRLENATNLLPDGVIVSLTMLSMARQAVLRAQEWIGPQLVRQAFGLGVVMLTVFILLNTVVTGESPKAFLSPFLFSALLAMGTARLAVLNRLRGGQKQPFSLSWIGGLAAVSLGIVGLASRLAAWMVLGDAQNIRQLPLWIAGLATVIMALIFSPLVLALLWILYFAADWLHSVDFLSPLGQTLNNVQQLIALLSAQWLAWAQQSGLNEWLPRLKMILLWGLFPIFAVLIVYWVISAIKEQNLRSFTASNLPVDVEFMPFGWRSKIGKRLNNLSAKVLHTVGLRRGAGLLAAVRVRYLYRQLMLECANLEHPRQITATPLEFLDDLAVLFPALKKESAILTQAYLQVRYGEIPENEIDLNAVETAWKRLQTGVAQFHKH